MANIGANRTRSVLQQSILGLVYRVGAVAASFAMMPLMLKQLGAESLGAWLVLLSVFQWVTFFDLGVSAGARNEIARAVANNDVIHAQRAVTTGWFYTVLITLVLVILTILILGFTPIPSWLKTNAFVGVNVNIALWVVAIGSCVSFILSYIQVVFAAYQQASAISMFSLLVNGGFLGLLYASQPSGENGLTVMSLLYLIALLTANLWLILRFFVLHPEILPRVASIDHRLRSNIMGFGIRLFIIQLAAMVIFTTDRLMVSTFVGPADVVVYDAGFKVFSTITMVHTLVMSTLWSSFTHAYEQKDWIWIKTSLRNLVWLMLPLSAVCIVIAGISPWIIEHWLGKSQVGPSAMYAWFAVIIILSSWSNIFAYFLNGIGNANYQLYSAVIAAVINIPLAYFFSARMDLGISGVLIAAVLSLTLFSLVGPWQVWIIIKEKNA